jgi:hypothetical protein
MYKKRPQLLAHRDLIDCIIIFWSEYVLKSHSRINAFRVAACFVIHSRHGDAQRGCFAR